MRYASAVSNLGRIVMAPSSPVVARWDLGRRLKEKRELLGLTGSDLKPVSGLSGAFLSDVESGKKSIPVDRLEALIAAYELDDEEAAELRHLREQAGQRGWWSKYNGLFSAEILRAFGFEHGAEVMLSFDNSVMIGLLQTREYAQAVIESGSPNVRLAEAGRRVQARLMRQRRLGGEDSLRLTAVMGEAALRQQVGGPAVL